VLNSVGTSMATASRNTLLRRLSPCHSVRGTCPSVRSEDRRAGPLFILIRRWLTISDLASPQVRESILTLEGISGASWARSVATLPRFSVLVGVQGFSCGSGTIFALALVHRPRRLSRGPPARRMGGIILMSFFRDSSKNVWQRRSRPAKQNYQISFSSLLNRMASSFIATLLNRMRAGGSVGARDSIFLS
jgi:hypothetical protein